MLPLIYTDSVAAAIFLEVCREATIQDRGSMVVLIGLQWVGLAFSFWWAKRFPEAAIPWHRTLLFGIGGILIFLGLTLTNWASLVALIACLLTGYLYRVHVEERALIQSIGQPYAGYMRRTKRFIPHGF